MLHLFVSVNCNALILARCSLLAARCLQGYSAVVKTPMDFSTIKRKLNELAYSNTEEFKVGFNAFQRTMLCKLAKPLARPPQCDLNLIWRNAKDYNQPDDPIFKTAARLQKIAVNLFRDAEPAVGDRASIGDAVCFFLLPEIGLSSGFFCAADGAGTGVIEGLRLEITDDERKRTAVSGACSRP
jgi:hypothetical protein